MVVLLIVNIGGFVLLIASGAAVFFNQKVQTDARPPLWRWLRSHGWQLGILLGLLSFFSQYPLPYKGQWTRIHGIPFFAAEVSPAEGHPHGPGLPSLALNFLFWLVLPQFALWVTSGRRHAHSAATPSEPPATGHEPFPM